MAYLYRGNLRGLFGVRGRLKLDVIGWDYFGVPRKGIYEKQEGLSRLLNLKMLVSNAR